jgi:predicted nucleic acid-binding protein
MKIYLETSIFNRYFDVDPILHPATVQLFREIKAGKFEPYTLIYVLEELSAAPVEKSTIMLNLIPKFNISILPKDDIALKIANSYIEHNIIPLRYRIDAIHIAIAIVNYLDAIISLNFKHIVRKKTKDFAKTLYEFSGYHPVDINSPMEVINNDYLQYK